MSAVGDAGNTQTKTITNTVTATDSASLSDTATDTGTATLTSTVSLLSHNYTMELAPEAFRAGQELRGRLVTEFLTPFHGAYQLFDHFNTSDVAALQVRVYAFNASLHDDCSAYVSHGRPVLHKIDSFGLAPPPESGEVFVSSAHFTFVAPHQSVRFLVCFRHNVPEGLFDPTYVNRWNAFVPPGAATFVFQSVPEHTWYHLPDPSVGQYAIVQLVSGDESWNFTYAPSACASDLRQCALGDNLKIVPQGAPCTYEFQAALTYYGSNTVDARGVWEGEAVQGLREGATAGGVGVFGTQYANPLVDAWSSEGNYAAAPRDGNITALLEAVRGMGEGVRLPRDAYVYLRLPQHVARFDVCYSARQRRLALATQNTTLPSIPLWQKLFRCSPFRAGSCSPEGATSLSFATIPEEVGWSMADLSPGTWGEIVFDDSGRASLSNLASGADMSADAPEAEGSHPAALTPTASYWAPRGGDTFRIVEQKWFGEATLQGRAHPLRDVRHGTTPSQGCWARDRDAPTPQNGWHGGFTEDRVPYPIGSNDLLGDPSDPRQDPGRDTPHSVNATFSPLYVPRNASQWFVCYRRTCPFPGPHTCTRHSGFRVLPFHKLGRGAVPPHWLHLGDAYPPGAGVYADDAAHLLVPGTYGEWLGPSGMPPELGWWMNDTRAGTWGPLLVERVNASIPTLLDSRRWDMVRRHNATDRLNRTAGSALRLVQHDRPCDYTGFTGSSDSHEAASYNGGMVECNSADAEGTSPMCLGSASDLPFTQQVAFYALLPPEGYYRVCFRLRGWNWREVPPAAMARVDENGDRVGPSNDPWHPMPPATLQRDGWRDAEAVWFQVAPAPEGLSVDYREDRAGMEAVLLFRDAAAGLAAAPRLRCPPQDPGCARSGDVFRLVPRGGSCDVNHRNWVPRLADTFLSPVCEVGGWGTPALSGLLQVGNATDTCAGTLGARQMCGGVCSGTNPRLAGWASVTPHPYDDMAPFDAALSEAAALAAVLTLPPHDPAGTQRGNLYSLCYKQVHGTNWQLLNTTFQVMPPLPLRLDGPHVGSVLLGGSLQRFALAWLGDVGLPTRSVLAGSGQREVVVAEAFRAKLVPLAAGVRNNHCGNPAGGTEGMLHAGGTERQVAAAGGRGVVFYLNVPQRAGDYMLCVQLRRSGRDAMSWWRPSPDAPSDFRVVDNGVRWFVGAGSEPTNQGMSRVSLLRCSTSTSTGCVFDADSETFETGKGRDTAKVVDSASGCSDGSGDASYWGLSHHVGTEAGVAGVSDLGPADGPADLATFTVYLPPVAGDSRVTYKVCVQTAFRLHSGTAELRWVEASQAAGLPTQAVVHGATGPAFHTAHAHIAGWRLEGALQPHNPYYGAVSSAAIAFAGASTQYVKQTHLHTQQITVGNAFTLTTHGTVGALLQAGVEFKFVAKEEPHSRLPRPGGEAAWGSTAGWASVEADCASPGEEGASNVLACEDGNTTSGTGACPHVSAGAQSLSAVFHFPLRAAAYLVCMRIAHPSLAHPRPWLKLSEVATNTSRLYTHPTFLEMTVDTDKQGFTAYDVRTVVQGVGLESASSWCAVGGSLGARCPGLGGLFPADLATIVNDTQVCPAPTSAPTGSAQGPPQWFTMARYTNASVRVNATWSSSADRFVLPPAAMPSASGQYKLCVYKAGVSLQGNASLLREGVVYQLYNRGPDATGGQCGFWRDGVVSAPAQLVVAADVEFNSTERFMAPSDTASSAALPDAAVTDPLTGQVSRTPLLRSGSIVTYTVSLATALGNPVPLGTHLVTVLRCPRADNWTALQCTTGSSTPADIGEFDVHTIGGACAGGDAALYGWEEGGLRQFASRGMARFALQYRSRCPDGPFGCGVRFAAETDSGTVLSEAQWVNVQHHYPDGISVDGELIAPWSAGQPGTTQGCTNTSKSSCLVRSCRHGELCEFRIQARFNGPAEYAPLGTVSLLYSESDYGLSYTAGQPPPQVRDVFNGSVGGQPLLNATVWARGGAVSYSFVPYLMAGYSEAVLFFNVTYGRGGRGWSRFAVRVAKPAMHSVSLSSIMPLDANLSLTSNRAPSPSFEWAGNATTLSAAPGVYLEALTPYELVYIPRDGDGRPIPLLDGVLAEWTITASVRDSQSSVLALPPDASTCYVTEPLRLQQHPFVWHLNETQPDYALRFRIHLVDNTCSRFAGAGLGCTVVFAFSNRLRVVEAVFASPVRIPASTLQVVPAVGTDTVRQGIVVEVHPGTYVEGPGGTVFVYDEFHYGDAFALLDGPAPTDGTTNRDGLVVLPDASQGAGACMFPARGDVPCIARYPMRRLASGWGASWRMKPDRPCNRCSFTFHTMWGAGPESFTLQPDGSQRGTAQLTWEQEEVELRCSSLVLEDAPGFSQQGFTSDPFVLTVEAGVVGDAASAEYPRWWVYTNASVQHVGGSSGQGYVLGRPEGGDLFRVRMQGGARATFQGLTLEGNPAPAVGAVESFEITFHSVGLVYDASPEGLVGSMPVARRHMSCVSTVQVRGVATAESKAQATIQLDSVSGADAACAGGVTPCYRYRTTVSRFANLGLTVAVSFHKSTATATELDTTPRNITFVPGGGPGTSPLGSAPGWVYEAPTRRYRSAYMQLDSDFNPPVLERLGNHTYTFGRLSVVAERPRPQDNVEAVAPRGEGQVKLVYGSVSNPADPDQSPVRKAVFKVCDAQWTGKLEATGSLCIEIGLWVMSDLVEPRVGLWGEPGTGSYTPGYAASCAAEELSLSAAPYYTPAKVTTGYRYYVYDTPFEFSLSADSGQYLVAKTESQSAAVLQIINTVPAAKGYDHTERSTSLHVTFRFTGRDVVPQAGRLAVKAQRYPGKEQAQAAASSGLYAWVQSEQLSHWEVSDEVTLDKECPTKRHMQATEHHYRTYTTTVPGKGWRYADQAVLGLPFPIQTVVRNTKNERATSFASGTLVKATKVGWTGCNDGGTMTIYDLKPTQESDPDLLYDSTLEGSWVQGTGGAAVATHLGVAVLWPVFTQPCQACVLRLDLCYTGRGVANCMEAAPDSQAPSDTVPIYADRTKHSKPFHVKAASPDVLQVYRQTLPTVPGPGPLQSAVVGEVFSLRLDEAVLRGGLSLPSTQAGWTRDLWVHTVWRPSNVHDPTEMRYGSGGFLLDGQGRTASVSGCDAAVLPEEFGAAERRPHLALGLSGSVRFLFTRPCSACLVRIDYRLSPPAGVHSPPKHGSFLVRPYANNHPGAPLVVRVSTCGIKWSLAPAAPAVRRRRHFSLTVLWTDGNNMLATGNASSSVAFGIEKKAGNGGGGKVIFTSPIGAANTLQEVDGSATIRFMVERACYACRVSLAGVAHDFSVLTEATQIVAVPRYARPDASSTFDHLTGAGIWAFDVYAADDLGDRSYLVAGPTAFALHPRYQTPYPFTGIRAGAGLSVSTVGSGFSPQVVLQLAQETVVTTLNPRLPEAKVTKGSVVYNGVPVPHLAGEVGPTATATVELTVYPGAGVALQFKASTLPGLPTSVAGSKHPPVVDFTVPATHLALDNAETAEGISCTAAGMSQGMPPCTFRAYAVSQSPGGFERGLWFQSVEAITDPVRAEVDCNVCGVAAVSPAEAYLRRGVAGFTLKLLKLMPGTTTACSCKVTVVPPQTLRDRQAAIQTFTVSFTPKRVAMWKWVDTSTFVSRPSTDGLNTAHTVPNRSVRLGLKAFDGTGTFSNLGGLVWEKGNRVTLTASSITPTGCFECFGKRTAGATTTCDVIVVRDELYVEGAFRQTGPCVIAATTFSDIPIGDAGVASPSTGLRVEVQSPVDVVVVDDPAAKALADVSSFSGLWGRTSSGLQAAVCGMGAKLQLKLVDAAGLLVDGDNHMRFTLKGTRTGKANETWPEQTLMARAGVVSFHLDTNQTTRGCDTCPHFPWNFEVVVVAPMASDVRTQHLFKTISITSPLHFVRRASAYMALGQIAGPCTSDTTDPLCRQQGPGLPGLLSHYRALGYAPLRYGGLGGHLGRPGVSGAMGRHPASWGVGAPFNLVVLAVDNFGALVEHAEDVGSVGTVVFRPLAVPCRNVDAAQWVETTCIDKGGTCDVSGVAQQPTCDGALSSEWKLSDLRVLRGRALLRSVVFGSLATTPEGIQRLMLTTNDLDYPWHNGWVNHKSTSANPDPFGIPDDVTLHEMYMQVSDHLSLTTNASLCSTVGPGPVRCDTSQAWDLRAFSTFEVVVGIKDSRGALVESDSASVLRIQGRCVDGINSAFLGNLVGDRVLNLFTFPDYTSHRGLVRFGQLQVDGPCTSLRILVNCVQGTCASPQARNTELEIITRVAPSPRPTDSPGHISSTFVEVSGLSLGSHPTATEAMAFIGGIARTEFAKPLLTLLSAEVRSAVAVELLWACAPASRSQITDTLKNSSACVEYYNASEPGPDRFSDLLQEGVDVVVEFVLHSSVPIDVAEVSAIVNHTLVSDLASPVSALRSSGSVFQQASAAQLAGPCCMGIQIVSRAIDRANVQHSEPVRGRRVYIDGDSYVWRRIHRVISTCSANDFGVFVSVVRADIKAWHSEHLEVVMFFDGHSGRKKSVTSCKRVIKQLRYTCSEKEGEEMMQEMTDFRYLTEEIDNRIVPVMLYKRLCRRTLLAGGVRIEQCWGEADQPLCVRASQDKALVVGDDSDLMIMADKLTFLSNFHPKRGRGKVPVLIKDEVMKRLGASERVLSLCACLLPNDFLPDLVLHEIRGVLGERELPKVLEERLVGRTPEAVLESLAREAGEAYGRRCANSEEAARRASAYFLQELVQTYTGFTNPASVAIPEGTPGLPHALVSAFTQGSVGQEIAFLARQGETKRLWKYPVMPEIRTLPPVQSHFLPVRRRIYELFAPLCGEQGAGGTRTLQVIEQSRDSLGLVLNEVAVEERPDTPFTLESLWGAHPDLRGSAVLRYFVQDLCVNPSQTADHLASDVVTLVCFLMATAGVCHPWEIGAFIAGVHVCMEYKHVQCGTTTFGEALFRREVPTERFVHIESLFFSALHTVILCNEVSAFRLFGNPLLGDSPLSVLLSSFSTKHVLVIYSLMVASYDAPKYTRMQSCDNTQGERVAGQSPFNTPAIMEELLRGLPGPGTDLCIQFAEGARLKYESVLKCIEWNNIQKQEPLAPATHHVVESDTFCDRRRFPDLFGKIPFAGVADGVSELAALAAVSVPDNTLLLCGQEEHATALCKALETKGRRFLDLYMGAPVLVDPCGSLVTDGIVVCHYNAWLHSVQMATSAGTPVSWTSHGVFCVQLTVEHIWTVPRTTTCYNFYLRREKPDVFYPVVLNAGETLWDLSKLDSLYDVTLQ